MKYTEAFFLGEANRIKREIDEIVANCDSLIDYFTDLVCGEENGRWIIGYGVYGGGGTILVCPTCVTVCGYDSEPFDKASMRALEEVMQMFG